LEWEIEIKNLGKKHFVHNNNQIQWERSLRCGFYCLLFLNERNKGTSYKKILDMFTDDVLKNEEIIKNIYIFPNIYHGSFLCERK